MLSIDSRHRRHGVENRREPTKPLILPRVKTWKLCLSQKHYYFSGHREPKLVGGEIPCSGRVEVKHGHVWGSVCDFDLSLEAASVVCRELQCGTVVSILGGAHFGEGSGQIWAEEFQCTGDESHLSLCGVAPPVEESCNHSRDVSLVCSSKMRKMSSICACAVKGSGLRSHKCLF